MDRHVELGLKVMLMARLGMISMIWIMHHDHGSLLSNSETHWLGQTITMHGELV